MAPTTLGVPLEAQEREVNVYRTTDGKIPYEEWLASLRDGKVRSRISARILRLRIGNFGDCKPITNGKGVQELRIDFGPGYRVYFGIDGEKIILLLCGGDKSTQVRDIEAAVSYWKKYKS